MIKPDKNVCDEKLCFGSKYEAGTREITNSTRPYPRAVRSMRSNQRLDFGILQRLCILCINGELVKP